MTDSDIAPPTRGRSDPVREGDALARRSQWQPAVSHWLEGHTSDAPELRTAADQRLQWLIWEAGSSIGQRDGEKRHRHDAYRLFLLAALSGAIATVLVVLGTRTVEGSSPVLAIGGWIGILASMIFTIAYALRLFDADHPVDNAPVTDELIARARNLAAHLDRQQAASSQVTVKGRDTHE